jgi:hypothetical protein
VTAEVSKVAYRTILKLADHALFKMVRYVLKILRPEAGARPLEGQLSIQINECLGAIVFEKAFIVCLQIFGGSRPAGWEDIETGPTLQYQLVNPKL